MVGNNNGRIYDRLEPNAHTHLLKQSVLHQPCVLRNIAFQNENDNDREESEREKEK